MGDQVFTKQLLTGVALFFGFISSARAQVPSEFFGMHVQRHQAEQWPTVPFGALRLWNTTTTWNDLEPSQGIFNWTNLDLYLNLAQQHNVDVEYTFGQTAAWASSGSNSGCSLYPQSCFPPTNEQDWKDFVTAVVAHAAGRIKYWEVWNEANAKNFWKGTTAQMLTMATDAYNIIKAADPTAIVLSPSVSGNPLSQANWLNGYFSIGGGSVADAVAFHSHQVDINNPDVGPAGILAFITNIKSVLAAHGLSAKQIWDTENGWRPQDTDFASDPRSPGYVAREYLISYSNGVTRLYWYLWNNRQGWGTLTGGTNAAGVAYGQVYDWLVGATMSSPCAVVSGTTWACAFTRPSGYQALVVWDTLTSTSYTPASQYKQYRDLSGNVTEISGAVTVGTSPILLENYP